MECIASLNNGIIISDRSAAIALVVQTVFPQAHHGLCCRHLSMNLRFKSNKSRSHEWMFWKACKTYRLEDFEYMMDMLRSSLPYQVLDKLGHHKWARARFPRMRYNFMTSNSAKFVNSLSRYARKLTITMLLVFFETRCSVGITHVGKKELNFNKSSHLGRRKKYRKESARVRLGRYTLLLSQFIKYMTVLRTVSWT